MPQNKVISDYITFLGRDENFAENGYKIFDDGLIIQWGISSPLTSGNTLSPPVIFPITFPNTCLRVIVGTQTDISTGQGAQNMAQFISSTNSQFLWFLDAFVLGATSVRAVYLAIGY